MSRIAAGQSLSDMVVRLQGEIADQLLILDLSIPAPPHLGRRLQQAAAQLRGPHPRHQMKTRLIGNTGADT